MCIRDRYGNPGGNSDPDSREGLTVYAYRTMDWLGDAINSFTIPGNATTTGGDWQFMTLNSGYIDVSHNFEDSTVSAPESDQEPGFSNMYRYSSSATQVCSSERCKWVVSEPSSAYGPESANSFPYMYKIGVNGGTDTFYESSLVLSLIHI